MSTSYDLVLGCALTGLVGQGETRDELRRRQLVASEFTYDDRCAQPTLVVLALTVVGQYWQRGKPQMGTACRRLQHGLLRVRTQPISSCPVFAPLCYMQGCGVLIWVGQLRVLTLAFIGTPVVGDRPDTKVRKTTDISQF